ncbi:hypothetical protein OV450_0085 [Actinobacteria bacterium OV450]|nr:hypothetical protein OV450_0085 [Actinobacteria bacterium OV450]
MRSPAGLWLWLCWQPRELLRPVAPLHGDGASHTERAGIQAAIHVASMALLRYGVYETAEPGANWLLVRRPPFDAA